MGNEHPKQPTRGRAVRLDRSEPDIASQEQVLPLISEWIKGDDFSCLAAKAAVRRGLLGHAVLGPLGAPGTTEALHAHLERFVTESLDPQENFATFVAVFDGPTGLMEEEFEGALWGQLQELHDYDAQRYGWAAGADDDPESPHFAFSVAEHPFFVVGLHDAASRITRRFPLPAVAFNSHHQFDRLKRSGVYAGLQRRIREREMRLQHSVNPNLSEFGDISEARQYSGRSAEAEWKCPFRPLALKR
ncbi:guanitoxin biosynthesis heme-dependent pre-guanitoxin N-hydroxylase GntA (plasmid) [Streptomyces sp. P9-2B-2]|uniref:guanitoxin biosynthesis heme-dependent pre-guanitoxin N-hydroxylase GntA n=1 Tax=Streptomyces sp. P9-2B-2 TaxID=3057114 RepID=UPI0025B4E118|nr:guanitoxin biosynthesis heme-dependent pre-guanitoxin N-hydroxylase GntA [Streptomyces sp. P9-2B-2]WJY43278.1 guanitoxin biosynthesis heme-dependent pre-guanitoxin N-hydroxylase GntA [Streptomyces sp. P9-2B-2]